MYQGRGNSRDPVVLFKNAAEAVVHGFAKMAVGEFGHFTSAGGALDETFVDKERFVNLLECAGILTQGRGYRGDAYGSTPELGDDGGEYRVLDLIESIIVKVKGLER